MKPRKWSDRSRVGIHVPTQAQRDWNGRGFGKVGKTVQSSESWWLNASPQGFTKQVEARVFSGTEANYLPREL